MIELESDASRQARIIEGEADARRNAIFAEAFGQDEEFFQFYRSLDAYRSALQAGSTRFVMSPEMEFFDYLRSPSAPANTDTGDTGADTAAAPAEDAAGDTEGDTVPAEDAPATDSDEAETEAPATDDPETEADAPAADDTETEAAPLTGEDAAAEDAPADDQSGN